MRSLEEFNDAEIWEEALNRGLLDDERLDKLTIKLDECYSRENLREFLIEFGRIFPEYKHIDLILDKHYVLKGK